MRRFGAIGLMVAALAGCGGGLEPAAPRSDAVPLPSVLSAPLDLASPAAERARLEAQLARDPDQVGALNDLAVAWLVDGQAGAAQALLDEVIARGGPREQQSALVNLGAVYAQDGYLPAAAACFETARDVDPARPEPIYALAALSSARGDPEKALALAREAARLDDGERARAALAFAQPEGRLHLEALAAEARGDADAAAARWRALAAGRYPALAATAERRLEAR